MHHEAVELMRVDAPKSVLKNRIILQRARHEMRWQRLARTHRRGLPRARGVPLDREAPDTIVIPTQFTRELVRPQTLEGLEFMMIFARELRSSVVLSGASADPNLQGGDNASRDD